jgi:regulator of protease activity HflC (stomatin/prohibitin superfamily)
MFFKKRDEKAGRLGEKLPGGSGTAGSIKHIEKTPLVKNRVKREKRRDFSIGIAGIALLVIIMLFVITVRLYRGTLPSLIEMAVLVYATVVVIVLMIFWPKWSGGIKIAFLVVCAVAVAGYPDLALAVIFAALAVIVAPSLQKAEEWERAIVLRFGKFHGVRGPGLFFLIPLADRVASVVDIRIRVTDFSAQETLTKDSVTVTVDALCFWLVWDPEKAILELENYNDAVVLSSKTALRNAVSSNDLSTFLQHGELIAKQIQEEVDRKTTDWGITVQHIEITDIQIPEPLQDSLSKVAQAEREKKSRILLAEAEIEIARKLQEAVEIYAKNEPAMKLKILSILNEGLKAGNSMMLVPSSMAEELKTKDVFGLESLAELRRHKDAVNGSDKNKGETK